MKEEIYTLKKKATFCASYQFLGYHFMVRSDSEQVLDRFKAIYRHFQSDGNPPKEDGLTCYLLSNTPLNKPMVMINESCYLLKGPEITPKIYFSIFNAIASSSKKYLLVHGGVISWKGKGVIISGHSTFGKTTLIIELIKRGFMFLSDELAPIHRSSHEIATFPRSLTVREGALRLFRGIFGQSRTVRYDEEGDREFMIDIEDIYKGRIGDPCRPRYVIFLGTNLEEDLREKEDLKFLEIALSGFNEDLLRDVKALDGVVNVSEVPGREYPLLRLSLDGRKRIVKELKKVCDLHRSSILYSVPGKTDKPDFNISPVLKPISKSQGIMKLMRMILPTTVEYVFDKDPCRMVIELADIAENIEFYKLSMGKLEEMAELVTELLSANHNPL